MQKHIANNNCACPLFTKLRRSVVRAISIQGEGGGVVGRSRGQVTCVPTGAWCVRGAACTRSGGRRSTARDTRDTASPGPPEPPQPLSSTPPARPLSKGGRRLSHLVTSLYNACSSRTKILIYKATSAMYKTFSNMDDASSTKYELF